MMRLLILGILLFVSNLGFSQNLRATQHATSGQEKIKQIKIAKLTSDMRLSKTQAERFWPIYNAFDAQRRDIRREIRSLSQKMNEDDDVYKKQLRIQDLKQKELDLTKRYRSEFLKVITEHQFGVMLSSEERFNQTLLEQLRERNKDE